MDINFNSNKRKPRVDVHIGTGGYEGMVKIRKEQLPEYEKMVNELFKDYDGRIATIIINEEDENGIPTGARITTFGASEVRSQVAHVKSIRMAGEQLIEGIMEVVKTDPKLAVHLAKVLADALDMKIEERE